MHRVAILINVTQTEKARATAQTIIDAATALFFDHGYDGTTIAMVANKAGVAHGTVILRVGSKSELAVAAFSRQISNVVADTAASLHGDSARADLASFGASLYAWYQKHEAVAPSLLREALFCKGPWAADYQQTVADTVAVFTEILERHLDPGIDTALVDTALIAEGILADYVLVLMYAIRGSIPTVEGQVAHFLKLGEARLRPLQNLG